MAALKSLNPDALPFIPSYTHQSHPFPPPPPPFPYHPPPYYLSRLPSLSHLLPPLHYTPHPAYTSYYGFPGTVSYYHRKQQNPSYYMVGPDHYHKCKMNPPLISSSPAVVPYLLPTSTTSLFTSNDHQQKAASAAPAPATAEVVEMKTRSGKGGPKKKTISNPLPPRFCTKYRAVLGRRKGFFCQGRGRLVFHYGLCDQKQVWKPNSPEMIGGSGSCGGGGGHPLVLEKFKRLPGRKLFPAKKPVGDLEPIKENSTKTSIMIRNIPSKYTRKMLVEFLDHHCRMANEEVSAAEEAVDKKEKVGSFSAFDFLYLPIDFDYTLNKGYAFVNFTNPKGVWKLYQSLNNYKWGVLNSKKICELAYARIQGKDALVKRFKDTNFKCDSEEYLPMYFSPARDGSDGVDELVKQFTIGRRCGPPSIAS